MSTGRRYADFGVQMSPAGSAVSPEPHPGCVSQPLGPGSSAQGRHTSTEFNASTCLVLLCARCQATNKTRYPESHPEFASGGGTNRGGVCSCHGQSLQENLLCVTGNRSSRHDQSLSPLVSCSVTSDSLPARLLCPWDSPGKNTGVGCPSLLQGIFLMQGLNPELPHCRQILYLLSHQNLLYSRL